MTVFMFSSQVLEKKTRYKPVDEYISRGIKMLTIQVGLVDTTGAISSDLLHAASAALNIQVTRDLPQFWNVQASVQFLPNPKKIPAGVWPVQLVATLPPGEGGFHSTKHNQPYAKV